jgi:hypothetical protein
MRRVRPLRSFIVPEVDILYLSCNLAQLADTLPELLMAQGVITKHGVEAEINGGPEVNNRKRARKDGSPGPSKRHTASTVKKEEISANSRAQRIQALQVRGVFCPRSRLTAVHVG